MNGANDGRYIAANCKLAIEHCKLQIVGEPVNLQFAIGNDQFAIACSTIIHRQ
jgi:hypothetical protein